MKFERHFTTAGKSIVEQIKWKTVPAQIDRKTAQIADVEVPAHWSQNAANIFADMYLRKAGVPDRTGIVGIELENNPHMPHWLLPQTATQTATFGAETSAKQVFHRLAGAWTYWGWRDGFFEDEAAAQVFHDEIYYCLAMQIASPNSPQWFNTGLHWAYGIVGPDSGRWRVNPASGEAEKVAGSYIYPQPHACFLTPTTDDLVNPGGIMDTWVREASIFKGGSGSGINVSSWRAKDERLSGGGKASGVMSWLSIGDKAAGAIQSGGTTRRAAKLVLLNDDHPELIEFIRWKVREEGKAAAMDVGSQVLHNMYETPNADSTVKVPQPMIDRLQNGFTPELLPATWESANMQTIDGQNSNNSVRASNRFMKAAQEKTPWNLIARTTGEVMKTLSAGEIWDELCRAAWACADPGLLFHDIINEWNTCAADGVIKTSNPCCEFHHLDGSACNLASLRLTAFLLPDGTLDLAAFAHVVRLWTMVLDISVSMASFPAKEFAEGAWKYRTLGLGYMDLGGLLMRLALPYDSDEGRALAAGLTALMTGVSYLTSAEMADHLTPFPRWEANASSFYAVMHKHADAVKHINCMGLAGGCVVRAEKIWEQVLKAPAFRNAQTSLIAPTGTIHLVADCDTSGMEPDFALVKHKQLAGGGSMTIVNQAVPAAAKKMGLTPDEIKDLLTHIERTGNVNGFNLNNSDRPVFDCVAELEPMAHVKMVAAIQPFLSGAASKTVNLPNSATVEDVSNVYRTAWEMGIKAISLYRDGSKLTQPLASAKKTEVAEIAKDIERSITSALARGQRESLPHRRRGETQKARVGGQTVHYTLGFYDDGRVGELFINLANAGSTLGGFAGSLAKLASIALGYGAPAEKVFDAMLGVKFEPAGFVELHGDVKQCESIPDLIARDVMINHLGRDDLSHTLHMVAVDTGEAIVALDKRAVAVAVGKPTGETCRGCGGILVQDGRCKTCISCGDRVGGCG